MFPAGHQRHTGEMPTLDDIAQGLGRIIRFAGQTEIEVSVGEHSIIVAHLCDPRFALLGLLHDAAEAVTGDVVGTWKSQEQSELELGLLLSIIASVRTELGVNHEKYNYYFSSDDAWEDVSSADKTALSGEAQVFGHSDPDAFPTCPRAVGVTINTVVENYGPWTFANLARTLADEMVEREDKLDSDFVTWQ